MTRHRIAALALCLPLLTSVAPPRLPMSRDVKKAFARGTRSLDGRPGPAYWQNHARYTITLDVAPPSRTIRGSETIVYHNNSPDTLSSLYFKLLGNIHKPGAPRDGGASADYLTSGVQVDRFSVNGRSAAWGDDSRTFTNKRVPLAQRLAPHDSVQLEVAWHYDVSREAGREGMLDSTTFFLAYFYPRIAVYDDYNGWDRMTFTDGQEFYADFNDYDVTVRVPERFVVWGTGTLVNAGDVLQPTIASRLQTSFTADAVAPIATLDEMRGGRVTKVAANGGMNGWRFTSSAIPDVTFAVSDHYVWDAASVVVDTVTKRRASVQAAYNDTAADFHHMVGFAQHSLSWLSRNWPGVPYPYEKTTIVQGGADMEYPMMVNDGSTPDTAFSKFVVEHEIAHSWFPFYMGINETRYAMMDEGWATTFEHLIGTADMGAAKAVTFYQQFRVTGWIHDSSSAQDLPIITPEDALTAGAWGNNAYVKASLGYLALKDMLGDATFKRGLHAFMDRWHGKHPIPWDFFHTVNDVTGTNLDWFWTSWYFAPSYIDIGVTGVAASAGSSTVTLANVGGMPAPVDLVLTYADGTTDTVHQTPRIWQSNQQQASVKLGSKKAVQSVALAHGIWMDADTTNDHWTRAAARKR